MKTRYIWLLIGMAFAAALAVVVGQRLSSEAMAVMVGVVAGVAASIPTSLIVVWVATRTLGGSAISARSMEPRRESEPERPQMIVLHQQPAMAHLPAGYAMPQMQGYAPAPQWPVIAPPRNFTFIGGAEAVEVEPVQEATWQQ